MKQKYGGRTLAVNRDLRNATITAMLKPGRDRYPAHDAEFFEREAVAAASRNN